MNQAWLRWAAPNLRKKYEDDSAHDMFDENSDESAGMRVLLAINAVGDALQRPQRKENLRRIMQQEQVELLKQKTFIAYGFPANTNIRTPRRIEPDFWINNNINWENEFAEDANSKFIRIRIIDPDNFPNIDFKPKIGRKSYKPLIHNAIKEISRTNNNFLIQTHKEKAQQIRENISFHDPKINPYGPGLGDDTIRKITNAYFEDK